MPENNISVENAINTYNSGVIFLDEKSRLHMMNCRAKELLSFDGNDPDEEVLKKFISSLKISELLSENDSVTNLIKIGENELLVYSRKVKDKDFNGFYIEFDPLTKHKEELKAFDYDVQASSLLRTILDSSNESFIYINSNGIIEMISESYAEFLNRKKECGGCCGEYKT